MGGNLRYATLDGQFWRLFSCLFLHAGVFHLVFNSYALLYIGGLLEPRFGNKKFLFLYVVAGCVASLASLSYNENIVSVGASGAIFGLYGVFLSLLVTNKLEISEGLQERLLLSIMLFIGYSLVTGFSETGIDNAAHIGGLASGFTFGIVYCFDLQNRKYSIGVSLGLIVLVGLSILILPSFVDNRVGEFQNVYLKFLENEKMALKIFNEASVYIPAEKVDEISDRLERDGIKLWKENIILFENLDDLPANILPVKTLLVEYSELRIKSYISLQNSVLNNEHADASELKTLMDSVDAKINAIKLFYGN